MHVGTRQRMIYQASSEIARLYCPIARGVEIGGAGVLAVDRSHLRQFPGQIGRADVDLLRAHQVLAPAVAQLDESAADRAEEPTFSFFGEKNVASKGVHIFPD